MTINLNHRRSLRLSGYDYSQVGAYFVTICVKKRQSLLGKIVGDQMQLSRYGKIAEKSWKWLSEVYDYVELDEWIIMPNHLHGILFISENRRGGSRTAPTDAKKKPLGRLIGAFKTVSTKEINAIRKTSCIRFWQRNFFEHVIRDDESLNRIREYVIANPLRWEMDQENPLSQGKDKFDTWLATFKRTPGPSISMVGAVREPPPKCLK